MSPADLSAFEEDIAAEFNAARILAADRDRLHRALAVAQLRAVNPISGRLASW